MNIQLGEIERGETGIKMEVEFFNIAGLNIPQSRKLFDIMKDEFNLAFPDYRPFEGSRTSLDLLGIYHRSQLMQSLRLTKASTSGRFDHKHITRLHLNLRSAV